MPERPGKLPGELRKIDQRLPMSFKMLSGRTAPPVGRDEAIFYENMSVQDGKGQLYFRLHGRVYLIEAQTAYNPTVPPGTGSNSFRLLDDEYLYWAPTLATTVDNRSAGIRWAVANASPDRFEFDTGNGTSNQHTSMVLNNLGRLGIGTLVPTNTRFHVVAANDGSSLSTRDGMLVEHTITAAGTAATDNTYEGLRYSVTTSGAPAANDVVSGILGLTTASGGTFGSGITGDYGTFKLTGAITAGLLASGGHFGGEVTAVQSSGGAPVIASVYANRIAFTGSGNYAPGSTICTGIYARQTELAQTNKWAGVFTEDLNAGGNVLVDGRMSVATAGVGNSPSSANTEYSALVSNSWKLAVSGVLAVRKGNDLRWYRPNDGAYTGIYVDATQSSSLLYQWPTAGPTLNGSIITSTTPATTATPGIWSWSSTVRDNGTQWEIQSGKGLRFIDTDASNSTTINAGNQATDITYTLPTAQGAASTLLQNNGSGTLSWTTLSGAGIVTGTGTTNQITKWLNTTGGLTNSNLSDNGTDISFAGTAVKPTIDLGSDLGTRSLKWNRLFSRYVGAGAANWGIVTDDSVAADSIRFLLTSGTTTATGTWENTDVVIGNGATLNTTGTGTIGTSLVPINPVYAQTIDSGTTATPVGRNTVLRAWDATGSSSFTATLQGGAGGTGGFALSSGGFTAASGTTSSFPAITTSLGTFTSTVASGGPAFVLTTGSTYSAGDLLRVQNNGTTRAAVNYRGQIKSTHVPNTSTSESAYAAAATLPAQPWSSTYIGGYEWTPAYNGSASGAGNSLTGVQFNFIGLLKGNYSRLFGNYINMNMSSSAALGTVASLIGSRAELSLCDGTYTDVSLYNGVWDDLAGGGGAGGTVTNLYGVYISDSVSGWGAGIVPVNQYGLFVGSTNSGTSNYHGFAINADSNFVNDKYLYWSTAASTAVGSRSAGIRYNSTTTKIEFDTGTTVGVQMDSGGITNMVCYNDDLICYNDDPVFY